MRNLIIASTSTLHGETYLEYLKDELTSFFKTTEELLFIPYARPGGISYSEYTSIAQGFFDTLSIKVKGIHEFENAQEAVAESQGIFTGGGNTFELVNQLYKHELMQVLRERINEGIPYLGTSAGSNICGLTMQTTNDMPIVYPPSFRTLGVIPFNINAHYLEPDPESTHMGETRAQRIKEFHNFNSPPVIGIKEGSWLKVVNETITLKGDKTAVIFEQNHRPRTVKTGSDLSNLN